VSAVTELWLMQLLWGVGPWLVFALLLVLAFIAYSYLKKAATFIRTQAIEQGWSGIPAIIVSDFALQLIVWMMTAVLFAAIVGTGFVFARIHIGLTRRYGEDELRRLTEEAGAAMPEMSIDFIFLLSALALVMTATLAVVTYRALRTKAGKLAAERRLEGTRTPIIVALYGKRGLAGILIILAGCYAVFSVLMQLLLALAIALPLPEALITIEVPGALHVAIVVVLLMWLGVVFMLTGPVGALFSQRLMFLLRAIRENRVALGSVKIFLSLFLFFYGYFLNKWLQMIIGVSQFPEWFTENLLFR
jgi:hypothetical protein